MKSATPLKYRFVAKLATNIAGLACGAVVMLFVPKALGAAGYGTADFLLAFFTSVINVAELGSSISYYTLLSRKPDNTQLVRGYLAFALLLGVCLVAFIVISFLTLTPAKWLWPEASFVAVMMGCLAGWLNWVQFLAQKTVDARGLTTSGELRILLCRVFGVMVLVAALICHTLTFATYQLYLVLLPLTIVPLLVRVVHRELTADGTTWAAAPAWVDIRKLAGDFRPYVLPMVPYTAIGALGTLLDRWVLQQFGGAAQQGFFSLGNRVATLCFVFSMAMSQLLIREFALVCQRGEPESVGPLFLRFVRPLYAVSAMIAVFVAWHAGSFMLLFGGRGFVAGTSAMTIMAFYPMHQTIGQLEGAVFYATANVKIYSRIGVAGSLAGALLLWLMVCPEHLGGFGLGSTGLATKMVLTQFVTVNVLLYVVARNFNIPFGRELLFQLTVPAALLMFVAASDHVAQYIFGGSSGMMLGCSAALYGGLIACTLWLAPQFLGLQKDDFSRLLKSGILRRPS